MIQHYLKVAVRSLMKYKMQTAISIVGLAVGFVCLAFSMIWIRYELTYDDFHRGAEHIYVPYKTSGLYLPALGYFFFLFLVSVLLSVVIIRYYSRKSIVKTLHHTIGNVRERMFFQQGSIIIQLTICVGILWGLSVLFLQLNHLSHTDIGFERDGRATFAFYPQEEGVIKDFHISAPTDPVQPALLAGHGVGEIYIGRDFLIRFDETRTADLHRAVESIMQSLDGHHYFELKTVREAYDEYLTSERSLMKLLAFVSVVCIVISLFGVYSHVTLACERRRKEIAIRKVNGATAWLIMQSFLKQYVWMLLLSCLIAFPVGTLVMRRWLEQYVEQTTINGWLYGLIMVILALFIGLCTGRSVWRAAHENPAEVIKRE